MAAVLGDADLGERQKQVLLDIYESFRRENAQLRTETGAAAPKRNAAPAAAAADEQHPSTTATAPK